MVNIMHITNTMRRTPPLPNQPQILPRSAQTLPRLSNQPQILPRSAQTLSNEALFRCLVAECMEKGVHFTNKGFGYHMNGMMGGTNRDPNVATAHRAQKEDFAKNPLNYLVDPNNPLNYLVDSSENVQNNQCPHCPENRSFKRLETLTTHIVEKHGEMYHLFPCPLVGQELKAKNPNTSTGDPCKAMYDPHGLNRKNKPFISLGGLRYHLRNHPNEQKETLNTSVFNSIEAYNAAYPDVAEKNKGKLLFGSSSPDESVAGAGVDPNSSYGQGGQGGQNPFQGAQGGASQPAPSYEASYGQTFQGSQFAPSYEASYGQAFQGGASQLAPSYGQGGQHQATFSPYGQAFQGGASQLAPSYGQGGQHQATFSPYGQTFLDGQNLFQGAQGGASQPAPMTAYEQFGYNPLEQNVDLTKQLDQLEQNVDLTKQLEQLEQNVDLTKQLEQLKQLKQQAQENPRLATKLGELAKRNPSLVEELAGMTLNDLKTWIEIFLKPSEDLKNI
jgi:hypothetical protein